MPRAIKSGITMSNNNEYMTNGVSLSPAVPSAGDNVKVMYDGLLAKNGATHIYAHVGFGSTWSSTSDYQMSRTATGFEATVPVSTGDTMNVCFKDCANNWDNNSGKNYTFDVAK